MKERGIKVNIKSNIEDIALKFQNINNLNHEIIGVDNEKIQSEIFELLNGDKPKIMVYGIYNAGKSTLINSLLGREAAEVRDCPMTDSIEEYDNGDYILVDSPGVDAPIEHQIVTEENLTKCHAILYVISTKGGFESIKNYQNMYKLMQIGKPFIIVINDKEGDPDLDQSQNINQIKSKIMQNLRKVSNNVGIENMFDTIAVNAKRGFNAQMNNKSNLYKKSGIENLRNRIGYFLDSKDAMRIYCAPLGNLITIIENAQERITEQMNPAQADELKECRRIINSERNNVIEDLMFRINTMVSSHSENFIQSAYRKDETMWAKCINQLHDEAKRYVKDSFERFTTFLKNEFEDIDFGSAISEGDILKLDNDSSIPNLNVEDMIQHNENLYNDNSNDIKGEKSFLSKMAIPAAGVAATAVDPLLFLIPVVNYLREKREKELQQFKELQMEMNRRNLEAEERANAEARYRQEVRMQVEVNLNDIKNELKATISNQFNVFFDNAETCILNYIDKSEKENDELTLINNELTIMKQQAMNLRSRIGR